MDFQKIFSQNKSEIIHIRPYHKLVNFTFCFASHIISNETDMFLRNNGVSLLLIYECLFGDTGLSVLFCLFLDCCSHFINLPSVSRFGPQTIRTI